jgi:acetyltransferase-like isoleucine patch superfamily enzyme
MTFQGRKISVRLIRKAIALFFYPLFIACIYGVRLVFGRRYVLSRIHPYARRVGAVKVLRILGAEIGDDTRIEYGISIQNALDGCCRNLRLGNHVYIGPECLFDLASPIVIEDEAAISARVSLLTHADVGNRPLKDRFPRREGGITVHRGAWIGVNTTILHGVSIGENSVIGAMSLVNKDIPGHCKAFGIPCRVTERHGELPPLQA